MDKINLEQFTPIKDIIKKARIIVRNILNSHYDEIPHDNNRKDLEMRFFYSFLSSLTKKWIIEILWELELSNGLNFNELKRHLKGISTSSLSNRLKDLHQTDLISRTVQDTHPPSVFYQLTDKGKGVIELSILLITHLSGF
jgi:DNA-binding HxlR family transcriptional regulator